MDEDFFEEDEDPAKLWAKFDAGEKHTTERPIEGFDVRAGEKFRVSGNEFITRPGVTVRS